MATTVLFDRGEVESIVRQMRRFFVGESTSTNSALCMRCYAGVADLWQDEGMAFTWGDTVRVKIDAPADLHPGAVADVVAITGDDANTVYTIEFGDGSDIEVAEKWLEPYVD
jgi:hypothetical protein